MKLAIGASLLVLLAACGKYKVTDDAPNLGQLRDFVQADMSAANVSDLTAVCEALADKATRYRTSYLNGYTIFRFDAKFTECSGNQVNDSDVSAKLRDNGGRLEYVVQDAYPYLVTEVETDQAGVIASFCKKIADNEPLTSPMALNTSTAVWVSFSSTCVGSTKCIQLQTGHKQTSGQYQVTMDDSFVIDVSTNQSRGNVVEHVRLDVSGCGDGKNVKAQSVLKSIGN